MGIYGGRCRRRRDRGEGTERDGGEGGGGGRQSLLLTRQLVPNTSLLNSLGEGPGWPGGILLNLPAQPPLLGEGAQIRGKKKEISPICLDFQFKKIIVVWVYEQR